MSNQINAKKAIQESFAKIDSVLNSIPMHTDRSSGRSTLDISFADFQRHLTVITEAMTLAENLMKENPELFEENFICLPNGYRQAISRISTILGVFTSGFKDRSFRNLRSSDEIAQSSDESVS